jgi:predicted nucleic acid-binding Zn ribbon protein
VYFRGHSISMERKKNDYSLKEALQLMLSEYKLKPRVNAARIKRIWESKMGKQIAQHTKAIDMRGNTLYLQIESAPLRSELLFLREKIKDMLNDELGEEYIKDVVVR